MSKIYDAYLEEQEFYLWQDAYMPEPTDEDLEEMEREWRSTLSSLTQESLLSIRERLKARLAEVA